jgi:hypothetical protein
LAAVRLRNAAVVSHCPTRSRRLEGERRHRPFCMNQCFICRRPLLESFRSIHDATGGDQAVFSCPSVLGRIRHNAGTSTLPLCIRSTSHELHTGQLKWSRCRTSWSPHGSQANTRKTKLNDSSSLPNVDSKDYRKRKRQGGAAASKEHVGASEVALPASTQVEPGALAAMDTGDDSQGERRGQDDLSQCWVLYLPLVWSAG